MISVIIPVFNGTKHITNCYRSLQNQTEGEWEAIFIDDGSTDRSFDILKSIAESDPRVKVLHKENTGVAATREVGINRATGEYITFLDVDDSLDKSALELFVKHFDSNDTDIVIGGINMVSENGVFLKKILYKPTIVTGTKCIDLISNGSLRWQLWGKAFRTNLIRKASTPYGLKSAEDMAVCLQASLQAQKVKIINLCVYNYVQVPTSVTHSKGQVISYDALKSANFIERIIGKDLNHTTLDCLYLLIISSGLKAGIPSNDKTFRSAVIKHGNLRALSQLPFLKALNVGLYKYLKINIAKYL